MNETLGVAAIEGDDDGSSWAAMRVRDEGIALGDEVGSAFTATGVGPAVGCDEGKPVGPRDGASETDSRCDIDGAALGSLDVVGIRAMR